MPLDFIVSFEQQTIQSKQCRAGYRWFAVLLWSMAFGLSFTAEAQSQTRMQIRGGATARYRAGLWGVLNADVRNEGTKSATVRCISWFDSDEGLMFGRDVSVPPESIRRSWYAVKVPDQAAEKKSLSLNWTSLDSASGRETFQQQTQFEKYETLPLTIPNFTRRIVVLGDGTPRESRTMAIFQKALAQLQPGAAALYVLDRRLPPIAEAWEIADLIVLTGDRIAEDTAAAQAMAEWVRRGGRVWVHLDLTTAQVVNNLFGPELRIDEMDRVSLTRFTIEPGDRLHTFNPVEVDLEVPVEHVRVVSEGYRIGRTINGLPASLSARFGRGHVVVSTVALPGWTVPHEWMTVKPPKPTPRPNRRGGQQSQPADIGLTITQAAVSLLDDANSAPINRKVEAHALSEFATSRIGYRTPGRSLIATVLLVHLLVAAGLAFLLHRLERATALLWALPVLAVAAGGALIAIGNSNRAEPEGRQIVQFVEAERGQSRLVVDGVLAFYSNSDSSPKIGSRNNTAFIPDRAGMESTKWRVMRSDFTDWHIENLTLRPGVRTADFSAHVTLPAPLEIAGTFDEDGFQGTLSGLPNGMEVEDALVAGSQWLSQPVTSDGSRAIRTSGDVLPPGEYLAGALVGEEQSRRQAVYKNLFRTTHRDDRPFHQPTLLFWSDALDIQSGDLDTDQPSSGSALFSVPIALRRPQPGATVRIPGPFIPYRTVGANGTGTGGAYFRNATGLWNEVRRAGEPILRFQIPPELLPLTATKATFRVKISAPLRDVAISAGSLRDPVLLREIKSPVGVVEVSLTGTAREFGPKGEVYIRLAIGDLEESAKDPLQDNYWQVEWAELDVHGLVESSQ